MHTGETWRLGRRADLDGLRGLAIVLVVVGHAFSSLGQPWSPACSVLAAVGVTLFFVLSGYLITGLLVRGHQQRGRIDRRRFYLRRLTRLGPPLATMVVTVVALSDVTWSAAAALTWSTNYAFLGGLDVEPFGITWSLAVEEQFYLVWPVALVLILRRPDPTKALMWLCGALLAWRAAVDASGHVQYAYVALETAGSPIVVGALVYVAGWRLSVRWSFAALAALGAMAVGIGQVAPGHGWLVAPLLATPLCGVMLAGAPEAAWLKVRPLGFCGVVSYSVYLWHDPVSRILRGGLDPVGVGIGVVFGLAAWALVERPVMRLRQATDRTVMVAGPTLLDVAPVAPPA